MIDDEAKALALMERMKAAAPIRARPTEQVAALLRRQGVSLGADPQVEIRDLFYAGDEGGITCNVTPEGSREVVFCSLTHLRVHPKHPLAGDIRAYQEKRRRGIAQQDGGLGYIEITRKRRGR
jgi:hypothetical protein